MPLRRSGIAGLEVVTSDAPPACWAVVITSDGAWEPLLGGRRRARAAPITALDGRVAAACDPIDGPASRVAGRVLQTAAEAGLDDNATVAAAHTNPTLTRAGGRAARALAAPGSGGSVAPPKW